MKPEKITILGMGYVGLTLAAALAEKEFLIHGVDINEDLVNNLNKYKPHFHEKNLPRLLREHLNENLFISTKIQNEPQDAFIVAVGTPIDINKKPVLTYLTNSLEQIINNLYEKPLVVIRSTVPIGTTRNIVKPILDKSNTQYHLVSCPERTAEGDAINELYTLPQVIGGIDEESVDKASHLFSKLTNAVVRVSSLEAAETIKLVCNCYRDVQFALGNEIALISGIVGLNPYEIIKGSNLGYERSQIANPGFVGGACLDKDPYILFESLKNFGFDPSILKNSRQLNENLPNIIAEKIKVTFGNLGKNKNAKLFITGLAFKGYPETNDLRGSHSIRLIEKLKKFGYSNIHTHDFVVSEKEIKHTNTTYTSLEEGFNKSDCVVIGNNNRRYQNFIIEDLLDKMARPSIFVDIWGMFDKKYVEKKGIIYGGIGI